MNIASVETLLNMSAWTINAKTRRIQNCTALDASLKIRSIEAMKINLKFNKNFKNQSMIGRKLSVIPGKSTKQSIANTLLSNLLPSTLILKMSKNRIFKLKLHQVTFIKM